MSKKTIGKIILTLAAVLAAGSVTAAAGNAEAAQYSDSLLQSADAEKLLYCETNEDYVYTTQS